MIQRMKLRARFQVKEDKITATCQMYDNTDFEIIPPRHGYEIQEEFLPSRKTVNGFVFVEVEGSQNNDICYVKLPCSTIVHGSHVTVKKTSLMPMEVNIRDFGPQKTVPENIALVSGEVLDKPKKKAKKKVSKKKEVVK